MTAPRRKPTRGGFVSYRGNVRNTGSWATKGLDYVLLEFLIFNSDKAPSMLPLRSHSVLLRRQNATQGRFLRNKKKVYNTIQVEDTNLEVPWSNKREDKSKSQRYEHFSTRNILSTQAVWPLCNATKSLTQCCEQVLTFRASQVHKCVQNAITILSK